MTVHLCPIDSYDIGPVPIQHMTWDKSHIILVTLMLYTVNIPRGPLSRKLKGTVQVKQEWVEINLAAVEY